MGFGGQWGYYRDYTTGLYLLTHRYYDAGAGRFVTRDPIGYKGGINLYGFAGNNPVNRMDPEGTEDAPTDSMAYIGNMFNNLTPHDWLHALKHNDTTRAVGVMLNIASWIPLPENPAADAKVVEGAEIVYRALKDSEIADVAAGKGILARPNGRTTLTQHIMGANKATTPFISTSRSLESARFFATDGGRRAVANPIIAIDLSKVTSPIHDISTPSLASRLLHPRARGFAAKHREVTIGDVGAGGHLNPEAIIGYVK